MTHLPDSEVVADLAEEFVERHRQGERPSIDDYVSRCPHLEREIRELFPTLLVVENLAPDHDESVVGDGLETLQPPATLRSLGDFRILREVGRGGMGIVYEAEQVSLGRRVALKVLPSQQLADAKQQVRFQREARSAAKLHHTNIVPVFGVGEENGTSYYVMQLIQGVGLDELLNELRRIKNDGERDGMHAPRDNGGGRIAADALAKSQFTETLLQGGLGQSMFDSVDQAPTEDVMSAERRHERTGISSIDEGSKSSLSDSFTLSQTDLPVAGHGSSIRHTRKTTYWDSVARIGLQVADALQYAHEHSILHRDIKPSNLLLDKSGTVWVADFGLAKALDQQDLTHTGDVLGTLRYMPPEAFTSKTDQRGDVYSLGITIYEMLALQPAFDEADRHRLIARVSQGSPVRLDQIDSEIPRDLVTIVHKSIERDPSHRYQNAKEMAEDFARLIDDEPIKARRVSSIERLTRWSRRNRGLTAAFASIAALLMLGTGGSILWAIQAERSKNLIEESQKLAEYSQYISNIQSANYHAENGSTFQTQRILKSIPPKYRNWEWISLADRAWQREALRKQPVAVDDFEGKTADFWRRGPAEQFQEIVGISGGIPEGHFTPDGTKVLFAVADGSLRLCLIATGTELEKFVHRDRNARMNDGTVSPDGTRLVTAPLTGWPLIFDASDSAQQPKYFYAEHDTLSASWDWKWSPDQRHVVSTHFDRSVRIWNVEKFKLVTTLTAHDREVRDVRFSESGDVLWTASTDGTVRKWSFPKGEPINDWLQADGSPTNVRTCPISQGLSFQVISPDRRRAVATFEDGSSFVWDIETGELMPLMEASFSVQTLNSNRRRTAVFSPDGTCVAIMQGLLSVMIYDVNSGKRIRTIEDHTSALRSIRFSPDGTKLMTTGEDGKVIIWTSRPVSHNRRPALSNSHTEPVYQIEIDATGNRLLSGSFDGTVGVSDLETHSVMQRYTGHDTDVVAVDFHNDGVRAASLDRKGHIHVWNVNTGKPLYHIDPGSDQFEKHMSSTGGGPRGELFSFPGVLSTGIFSPDGLRIVSFQNDGMSVFNARDGMIEVTLEGASNHGWPVFSHDSRLVCVLEMDGNTLRIWDVKTGKLKKVLRGHSYALCMISFSPVDDRIVTGGMAKAIIWNGRTGELLHELKDQTGYIASCRFSSDGRYVLTGSSDNVCRVWDAHSAELLTQLKGHTGRIRDIRLSPDGTRIVSWGTDDRVIVWDTVRPLANLLVARKGESRPLQAHWTPDGRDIVTAWTDGGIKVWAGATKEELSKFTGYGDSFEKEFHKWRSETMKLRPL